MSQSSSSVDDLAQGGIGRLLFRYSWPALVAMSLNALYAVVDRVYIGQGCGAAAMAGLQLALPAMMFFTACGVFIGIGHSTLLSIRLGEGNRVACEKILGELVALKILFSLVMPPLVFLNVDAVLNWCGGDRVSAEALRCGLAAAEFAGCVGGLPGHLEAYATRDIKNLPTGEHVKAPERLA